MLCSPYMKESTARMRVQDASAHDCETRSTKQTTTLFIQWLSTVSGRKRLVIVNINRIDYGIIFMKIYGTI
uniref:Uncharacterized protein n=1 Tax=Heterorhabditis bacteriophora TaxID=37862 RepID=A0A1I7WQF7_HETBA